ncbi:uncharacterized protein K460DRAFT_35103 [Cucurbitaria berberidis CBS 394.84]|uniref:RING-type domain-containing protein n=1 Tax=Cucurbitaria berberidis CBS 394.84 TaxID=1168544 RepID=A0A9P4GTI8_9PLEO|nr:uncharacterized protein K460DRAFT_35103 [Cucurbitaria berberidis CBS 394.84]KAF1851460.1 hypothetical protein K460DRAFT_35103 [Cucurbitaria berberidis CBS 394.84]
MSTNNSTMGPPSEATRRKLIAFFTTPVSSTNDSECMICLESLSTSASEEDPATNPALKLNVCGHVAHHHCLLTWSKESSNCPHCRRGMFAKPQQNRALEKMPICKFAIPFLSGEYLVSSRLYNEWLDSATSDKEYAAVMEFRQVWDESDSFLEEYLRD